MVACATNLGYTVRVMSRPTTDQADELRRLMQRLFRRFGVLAADATPCGKPLSMAHAHALMVLLAKGELSQQELGVDLCIDKSNVARLSARMVEAGHIDQRSSEKDGRSRLLSLTAKGTRLAKEVDAASGARFGSLLGVLPLSSRRRVLDSLQELVKSLDELPAVASTERKPK
jgi:DNA-binding MarR family transcriptional regulator